MSGDLLLGIDQGTTSTRAVVYDRDLTALAGAARPVETRHPRPGWVEVDAQAVLETVVATVAEVLETVGGPDRIGAAGFANQGETVVAWDAQTMRPLAPAIVWQCRRSEPAVERVRAAGLEPEVRMLTGLPLDPYFSAGKLRWWLDEIPAIQAAADAGRLRFGTIDAWVTAALGAGSPAGLTDPSTASRTQLFGLTGSTWDHRLSEIWGVAADLLPTIVPTAGRLATLHHPTWAGEIPLRALICDQQAALAGHGAFSAGMVKATYGTGVFVLANAADRRQPADGLETSIAWTLPDGRTDSVLQGGVFAAGALLDWLRDDLHLIDDLADIDALATSVADTADVTVVPALAGLGAPWYRPDARAAIVGLSAAAGRAHVVRAVLDGIAHRVADVFEAMLSQLGSAPAMLRVDGGLTRDRTLLQRQADLLGIPVGVATVDETTALGAAGLAGIGAGLLEPPDVARANPIGQTFQPTLDVGARLRERRAWREVLERQFGPVDSGSGRSG